MPDAGGILEARDISEMKAKRTVTGKDKYIKGSEHMGWGMRNRLSRLIQEDGHCFFLPIDHGYFQGPTRCLEEPGETIKPLLKFCDGLFVTRGALRSCVDPQNTKPIILRVSGGTSMAGKELCKEGSK